MVTCMIAILELVLFVLFLKAMVYTYDIISLALDKMYDKITNKIEKM